MGKFNFGKAVKDVQGYIVRHSPEILTALGITGMVTTTVLAVKATPKALNEIKKKEQAACEEAGTDVILSNADKVKACWKCYIPAAVTGVASIACLIGASSVNSKRNAVLATAYKLSETALTEYRDKVVETIGEKKEQVIRDKVHKDHIDNNPASSNTVILTGNGNSLCYDHHSGRYFRSDIETIRKAVNELNRTMLNEGYVSLNDFYDAIGIRPTSMGYQMGWNTDMKLIEVDFSAQLSDNGEPCLAIDFRVPPKYGYDRCF